MDELATDDVVEHGDEQTPNDESTANNLASKDVADAVDPDDEHLLYLRDRLAETEASLSEAKAISRTRHAELDAVTERQAEQSLQHAASRAHAVEFFHALLSTGLSASGAQRRILYLRDFASISYVFKPLVYTLLRAIKEISVPVLVIAGIWRFDLLPSCSQHAKVTADQSTAKHHRFLAAFEGSSSLTDYVLRKYPAAWRLPHEGARFHDLAHAFRSAFTHRFRYDVSEFRRRTSQQKLLFDNDATFTYEVALPVALHGAISGAAGCWGRADRARRLAMLNLPSLRVELSLESGASTCFPPTTGPEPSTVAFWMLLKDPGHLKTT